MTGDERAGDDGGGGDERAGQAVPGDDSGVGGRECCSVWLCRSNAGGANWRDGVDSPASMLSNNGLGEWEPGANGWRCDEWWWVMTMMIDAMMMTMMMTVIDDSVRFLTQIGPSGWCGAMVRCATIAMVYGDDDDDDVDDDDPTWVCATMMTR